MVSEMILLKSVLERFEENFTKKSPDECWEWKKGTDRGGYGRMSIKCINHVAHRISYKLYRGDPGELFVCHSCDNRICVNPNHLFLGTNKDNMNDRDMKGRVRRKITKIERAIVFETVKAGFLQREIARYFNLSKASVCRIGLNKQ
jgi:hypothetical protein